MLKVKEDMWKVYPLMQDNSQMKTQCGFYRGIKPSNIIEQKNTSKNPRSTVATVTEIYDYMRVLFAE